MQLVRHVSCKAGVWYYALHWNFGITCSKTKVAPCYNYIQFVSPFHISGTPSKWNDMKPSVTICWKAIIGLEPTSVFWTNKILCRLYYRSPSARPGQLGRSCVTFTGCYIRLDSEIIVRLSQVSRGSNYLRISLWRLLKVITGGHLPLKQLL